MAKLVVAKKTKRRPPADLFHMKWQGKPCGTEERWPESHLPGEISHVRDYPIPEERRRMDG
jgi:hypothetical protein